MDNLSKIFSSFDRISRRVSTINKKGKSILKEEEDSLNKRKMQRSCPQKIIQQETSDQIQVEEAPVSPDSSQGINVNTEYVQASRILNTNDPEVIKRFLKPCKDPLYVAFWKYQANKKKLLHLVRNPLTS